MVRTSNGREDASESEEPLTTRAGCALKLQMICAQLIQFKLINATLVNANGLMRV